jgi:competence protein ComEA
MTLVARCWTAPDLPRPVQTGLVIDINQASPRELSILPQVGPVLARRIVENRDRLGSFVSVDDLDRVHGIGPSTLQQIRRYCVAQSPQEP